MKPVSRVLKFEFGKLFNDKFRLFLLGFALLFIIGVALFFCYTRVLGCDVANYNQEVEAKYIVLRDKSYFDYLVAIGEEPIPVLPPGETYVVQDAEICYRNYQYYNFILNIKTFDFYKGFTESKSIFDIDHFNSNRFAKPLSGKLFYYQNIVFIFLPVIFYINCYFVFVTDKENGFHKNLVFFNLKNHHLFIGKVLFTFLFDLLIIAICIFPGLLFINGDKYVLYTDDYHVYSSMLIYFLRWLELFIVSFSIGAIFIIISNTSKNKYFYFACALPFAVSFIPLFSIIRENFSSGIASDYLAFIPFYNFYSSDSFLDGKLFSRIYVPLLILLTGFLYSFYSTYLKQIIIDRKI